MTNVKYYLGEALSFCKRNLTLIGGVLLVVVLGLLGRERFKNKRNKIKQDLALGNVKEDTLRATARAAAGLAIKNSNAQSRVTDVKLHKAKAAQEKAARLELRKNPDLSLNEVLAKLNAE